MGRLKSNLSIYPNSTLGHMSNSAMTSQSLGSSQCCCLLLVSIKIMGSRKLCCDDHHRGIWKVILFIGVMHLRHPYSHTSACPKHSQSHQPLKVLVSEKPLDHDKVLHQGPHIPYQELKLAPAMNL